MSENAGGNPNGEDAVKPMDLGVFFSDFSNGDLPDENGHNPSELTPKLGWQRKVEKMCVSLGTKIIEP